MSGRGVHLFDLRSPFQTVNSAQCFHCFVFVIVGEGQLQAIDPWQQLIACAVDWQILHRRKIMAEPIVSPELSILSAMSSLPPLRSRGKASTDQDIHARVHELLMLLVHPVGPIDRRADARYAYPYLVRLTPANQPEPASGQSTIVVVGKTLSERGFGFYHQQALPDRRMIASFHAGDDRWLGLLMDLRWCRFSGQGWYESGGRFLQAVPAVTPEK
jgi:hypothetical protein